MEGGLVHNCKRRLESSKLRLLCLVKPSACSVAKQDNAAIALLELRLTDQFSPLKRVSIRVV